MCPYVCLYVCKYVCLSVCMFTCLTSHDCIVCVWVHVCWTRVSYIDLIGQIVYGDGCLDVSYEDSVAPLLNTTVQGGGA